MTFRTSCLLPLIALLLLPLSSRAASAQEAGTLQVDALRVEHVVNPLGLDTPEPRLSWRLHSSERSGIQSAYRILVSTDPNLLRAGEATVWDSGMVTSSRSVDIPYDGPTLKSRTRYYWKVRVWDAAGRPGRLSETGWWETGLQADDWSAAWISSHPPSESIPPLEPAPFFRKTFEAREDVERARLYVSGLGYHEATLNGEKIGDHVLDPAATRYDRRVKYVVHDVTSMIREETNVLGVVLGNGWYNQHTESAWDFDAAPWRASPALLAQLEITYDDGTRDVVVSDETWRVGTGPVTFDGIRNGEHYDARLELRGWDAPPFDAAEWDRAHRVDGPGGMLSPQLMPPIRVVDTRFPVRIDYPTDSTTLYDFGQNLTGWVRLRVRGPAGAEVIVRYGERLFDDGTLDQRELSRFVWAGETQTDRYTLRGGETEHWHPRFVYHGFQFAEITAPSDVEIELASADVVHTDFERAGSFETSNALINQIHKNLLWSYLGNYHGYPTDCPHREKIGWSGDAHLAAQAGLYNFDAVRGYLKWMDDFADEQRADGQIPGIIPTSGWGYTFGQDARYRERGYGPSWEGAYVFIPWYLYQFTGDEAILEQYYDGLKAYVDYLADHAEDHLVRFGIDDHKPAFTATEPPIIQTGHYAECTRIVAEMGRILGRDTANLEARLASIRDAFHRTFYNDGTYGNGGQTSLAGALDFDLVPAGERTQILDQLLADIARRDHHIDAGVVGTRHVLNVLDAADANDIMYRMVTQTTYPGWGYWIAQGATTLWQDWEGAMSLNHVMFGSVGDWFYRALAGIRIDPENPGFKRTIIRPAVVDGLDWVRASHESRYGKIVSSWRRADDRLILDVRVPANTTALVHVPLATITSSGAETTGNRESGGARAPSQSVQDVLESGEPASEAPGVHFVGSDERYVIFEVGSGSYHFESLHP